MQRVLFPILGLAAIMAAVCPSASTASESPKSGQCVIEAGGLKGQGPSTVGAAFAVISLGLDLGVPVKENADLIAMIRDGRLQQTTDTETVTWLGEFVDDNGTVTSYAVEDDAGSRFYVHPSYTTCHHN